MKKITFLLFLFISISLFSQSKKELPCWDTKLTQQERIDDLLKRLTPQEKILLMMNRSSAIDRLFIPEYDWWNEALHGVARAGLATVFPQAIGMSATFNDKEHLNTFTMISDEARAKYHRAISENIHQIYYGLTFWTPNINIFRDPRWGRGMETYGEDPYLTSRFGISAVQGLQGDDKEYFKTHACAKHYAVHSGPEWNRHSYNAKVSDKDLWETYLPAFRALVVDANVQEVMCAYNRFENAPCCGSGKLLVDILRNKWEFKGLVVSDCGAIDDFYVENRHETHANAESASAEAVIAGTDIECGRSYEALVRALKQGLIKESDLDKSVRRIIEARFKLGMFDPDSKVKWASIPYSIVDCSKHKQQALKVAQESMTLLKNDNNTLPLNKNIKTLAVIGTNANDSVMMWANYNGFPSSTKTILKGIQEKFPHTNIIYDKGCDLIEKNMQISLMDNIKSNGKKGLYAEYYNNTKWDGAPAYTTTGLQNIDFATNGGTLFAPKINLENFSAKYTGEFTAPYTGRIYLSLKADDGYRLQINNKVVIENHGHEAYSKTTYHSFEAKKGQKFNIKLDYYQLAGPGNLRFLIYDQKPVDFTQLKEKIKKADAVVYVGGLSPNLEGEEMPVDAEGFKGGDRLRIELPDIQRTILKELRSTGKPVVFVLCTGSAIGLEDDDKNYDALLNAWYPGQAGGTAVADVLAGDYNPAGRLPVTFYKSTKQLPDFEDYNMKNRTYRFFNEEPMYPFGYGLSYTTFEYTQIKLSSPTIKKGEKVNLTVTVKNTGKQDGDEVVQVYIRFKGIGSQPLKSLKAFNRVNIKAGKTQQVEFDIPAAAFESYITEHEAMGIAPGEYDIMVGGSSCDKNLKTSKLIIQ